MQVRLPGRRTLVTRPYPESDPVFAAEVDAALRECRDLTTDAEDLRAAVVAHLRRRYPNTTVVAREPMASLVPNEVLWYVYRDRVIRPTDHQHDPAPRVAPHAARGAAKEGASGRSGGGEAIGRAPTGSSGRHRTARGHRPDPDQLRLLDAPEADDIPTPPPLPDRSRP